MEKLKFYCKFLFRLHYYKGIDKLTFWDWLYKRRLSFKDVKRVWKIINDKPEIPLKRKIVWHNGKPVVTFCNCPDRERCSICDTYQYCTFQPLPTLPLWAIGIMALITALAIYFSNLILF